MKKQLLAFAKRNKLWLVTAGVMLALSMGTCLARAEQKAVADGCPDIQVKGCAISEVEYTFYKEGLEPLTLKAPKGCRCSFMINGIEFVPSAPMPPAFCGEETDPEDPIKKDK